ncbi:MAG: ABC transporter ATP-binding protein [Deltaproteobacteria bacterium]|nr:ABC transporter ATP-binding protein [Deltaproteobacteria bacterium]
MIEMHSVVRRFNGPAGQPITALDRIDLRIEQGEFVTLVGPSGSGKSTLLFTIGAMMRPDAGKVILDGKELDAMGPGARARLRRTAVGFVFQTFNLIPYLSCLENLVLAARLSGDSRRTAVDRSSQMLQRLGLGERVRHRPSELSVGERQRVALGRAVIHRPRVLLADEPTGNLDPASTEQVMDLLRELHAEGQTIAMVTHDPRLAETGERVIGLRAGRLVEDRPSMAKGAVT